MQLARQANSLRVRLLSPETPLFIISLLVSALIVGLVAVVVGATFLKGLPGVENKLWLGNYSRVLLYPVTYQAALNTLLVGAGAVAVCLFLAVPAAWLIHRTNVPYKRLFLIMMFLNVVIPAFLKTIGWIILLSPKVGLINVFLRGFIPVEYGPLSIYNLPSIAFLQGLALTPVMFFMISGAFLAVDPSFEESAQVSGASRFQCLRRITLPLVAPSIVGGMIYTFMISVSMFEIAALLGMPYNIHVFSTLMFSYIFPQGGLPQYGTAGVYGLLLLVPTLVCLYFYQKMLRLSHNYATVTGKGYKPKLVNLGRWRWAGAGFIAIFFLLDTVLPFLMMVWISLTPLIQVPSLKALASVSLAGYGHAFQVLIRGGIVVNTVTLTVSVGIAVALLSIVTSWVVLRTRMPGRFAVDTISVLPAAVPRIAFALAVALVTLLLARQISLYGTVAAIIFAHTLAYLTFGTRTVNGTLIQIHNDLEDAVQTCGGSRLVAIRRVFVPLLAPTIAYVTVWTMLLSYREVTMALFLQTSRNKVLSTAIWEWWQDAYTDLVGALGTIMVLTMALIVTALLRGFPRIFLGHSADHS